MAITVISTKRYHLSLLVPDDYLLMMNYLLKNKDHLAPWEPARAECYYSKEEVILRIKSALLSFKRQSSINLVILNKAENEILGVCNFSNIRRGASQSCHLGYSLSLSQIGKGCMHEALTAALEYVFKVMKIQRVMANYLPENQRSANVLKKLGFNQEGYALSYLEIAGVRRDHVLTALINNTREPQENS